jgi:8-oxo-dGTP diphosphatase
MAAGDGNGWVECRCGTRHWGRHGAAGLLLLDASGRPASVLLQLRDGWTHQGGSWSLVGGARDSHEDDVVAALREAAEEAAVPADSVRVIGCVVGVDHVDWRYTYVVAVAERPVLATVMSQESDELRWVPVREATALPLHRGLGLAWPRLTLLIDRVLSTGQL